jgi:hypothetical protein
MATKKHEKNTVKFYCNLCNFKCSRKGEWNRHVITRKHINSTNGNDFNTKKHQSFICVKCNKQYSDRTGLWKHKQKCRNIDNYENEQTMDINDNSSIVDTMMQLIKENQEFKSLLVEQQNANQEFKELISEQNKTIIELSKKDNGNTYNNNNNTINNNNQRFNLNFFLNTTCKDAMNMSDFIENMEINFKDIENIGRNGYVSGMTEMILSRIKELDVTKRPLHCTDLKRETMYIKDNDEWCKDTPENTKLRKTIGYVAKRNYATIPLWREKYPECQNWNDPKYDFCVDMMRNILGDIGEKQTRLDNKVIKNLSKHIIVEKNI